MPVRDDARSGEHLVSSSPRSLAPPSSFVDVAASLSQGGWAKRPVCLPRPLPVPQLAAIYHLQLRLHLRLRLLSLLELTVVLIEAADEGAHLVVP